eukprot:TRINITY_DN4809_c0_g1_i16.p2 TRINITY_DN4809_c0_g1~~TRINITY_DN4809_c0_g1_i16.p2  ORF type:complete len:169 (-),score=28.01 TRINITY_DN4809_c0_g1_i16:68-574(-)
MFVLFGFYFFVSGIDEYFRNVTLLGQHVGTYALIFNAVSEGVMNVVFVVWVLLSLGDQNKRDRHGEDDESLDLMYKHFYIVFFSAVIFCLPFWLAEFAMDATEKIQHVFKWLWIVLSYWDWGYFVLISFLCWQWNPGLDNAHLSYERLGSPKDRSSLELSGQKTFFLG